MRKLFSLSLVFFLATCVGCGSPYPEPTVRTAEGHPGKCSECGKEIALVGEPNMITIGSTRFVVCDSKCGAKMTEKMEGQ
jgi:NAD-dependent SIR2 family protein deacetylase